ncbi:MAG: hypothetical protein ABI692_06635 [Terracoccus sp.]
MKTLKPPTPTDPSRTHGTVHTAAPQKTGAAAGRPLRHLAVAGVVLSLAALGACSSDGTSPSPSATAGATSPASTTSVPTSTAPSTTTPARVDKAVKVEIKDGTLGHVITATKLSRNLPWPAGNPVAAASFEIVGIQLAVDAGDRYSAEITPAMFTLKPGSAAAIAATAEFGTSFGAPLATTKRAEKKTGWLFFKVDRGSSGPLLLTFNRPAYTVKTTGTSIQAAALSKPIG